MIVYYNDQLLEFIVVVFLYVEYFSHVQHSGAKKSLRYVKIYSEDENRGDES